MSDSSQIVNTLKAKAMLLIQREQEIFALRLSRDRIEAWLQAFRRLSARARPELGESICAEWTGAMIEERHFQTAAAFRHDVATGDLFLVHGQSHTRLPETTRLDDGARRALREHREGLFDRSKDPDCTALARCLNFRCFVWYVFVIDDRHEMLLTAGVAEGIGGSQGAVAEEDLVYFMMVGQHLAALLRNGSLISELGTATRNLQELFDHMKQAIVAFDAGGSISGPSSREAKVLFERERLEGLSVRELLYPGAPAYDVDAASFSEWVDMAIQTPPQEWASCERYAPREVVIGRKVGPPILLELEFRPLVRDGAITQLMLLGCDVTEARRLEEVVQTHEVQHARQLAAMRRLIAGGAQVFIGFIDSARARLRRCEAILRQHGDRLPVDAVDELFRHAHTIRGEARAFDLVELEEASKSVEDVLDEMRNASHEVVPQRARDSTANLDARFRRVGEALERGCDALAAASPAGIAIFDQVTVPRSALRELTEYAQARPEGLSKLVARLTAVPLGVTAAGVLESAPAWAITQGSSVTVIVEPRELMVPQELAQVLPGVLTHLVRNAIAHGIEPAEDRRAASKPEQGTIRIVAEETTGGLCVIVEDDGRGLDVARIKEQQRVRGDSRDATDMVFEPGVSTREAPDALAGRGVGLDAVRRDLASAGYDIQLSHSPNRWTRLTMSPRREVVLTSSRG